MVDFLMPSLGADMDHGKIVEWLVKPGDYVRRGDIVAVVDTDKTVMDVETFHEGVVSELLTGIGETVPVGTPLARITPTPAETAPVQQEKAPKASSRPAPTPPVRHLAHRLGVEASKVQGTGKDGRVTRADIEKAVTAAPRKEVKSSPRARRLARESKVEMALVRGTGPGGAVTEADVRRYLLQSPDGSTTVQPADAPGTAGPPESEGHPPSNPPAGPPAGSPALHDTPERADTLRHAIGTLMERSKKTIPHYYLTETLDLEHAVQWMTATNAQRAVAERLVASVLLLKAAAVAARDVPEVNGFFQDGGFQPASSVHLGVAVALRRGGLVAPAIHDADTLSLDELMKRLKDLVSRARSGRLLRAEMADPTVTVTNLGDLGVESVYGVIYPPQVAMIGIGRVSEQAWARNGMLGIRHVAVATLSADHRVSDGLRGARFLNRMNELLQEPEEL
ncbi:dihydrolipoamide acetyltransferase family protein [Paenarthrobacter ureafaciens]|jgi:pyruvate dehydrogenase E2 component (dihydrolipoamide acetyltransferase)